MKELHLRCFVWTLLLSGIAFGAGYHVGHRRAAILCLRQHAQDMFGLHHLMTATNVVPRIAAARNHSPGYVLRQGINYVSEEQSLWEHPLARYMERRGSYERPNKTGRERVAELDSIKKELEQNAVMKWKEGTTEPEAGGYRR
jgi:hypothetical protein